MAIRKSNKADLRKKYPLFVELGLVITLAILVVSFRLDLRTDSPLDFVPTDQELIVFDDIPQSVQPNKPPPPPRPPVPVERPNDEVLEDVELDFETFLDVNRSAEVPPLPPPDVESDEDLEPEIFVNVEEDPVLIGGLRGLQSRITYPELARKAGVEGRVFLQFVVDEEGNVTSPVVTRGIGAGCDEEAVKAILQAKFTPGRQRGRAVKVQMSLPMTFRLR